MIVTVIPCGGRNSREVREMQHLSHYRSPLGELLLAADETGLTGAWFAGQKYFARGLDPAAEEGEAPALAAARAWLDRYFAGEAPPVDIPLHLIGTPFQREVWELLLAIPYGQTTTYGGLAVELARRRGAAHLSAQAVGGAVGRNPVSVIVPCHRVVGASGSLTGYAGGLDRKIALLTLEGADTARLSRPTRGTAL